MSRLFLATSDHLDSGIASVTGYPLAMSLWFKDTTFGGGSSRQIFNMGQAGTGNNSVRISLNVTDNPIAQSTDGTGTASTASSATALPDGTSWHVISGNFLNDTSRDVYWDGAHKASSVGSRTLGVFDSMRISGNLAGTGFAGGLVAHVAYWNNVLNDEEHRLLSCYTPNRVRSDILIDYWDLLADTATFTSTGPAGTVMTPTGSKFSLDNPQFAPAFPYYA